MKIHDLDPEIILKVNINCSNACPRKLEKYLMEISGVYTVVVHQEKSLVTVRGKVDPRIVLEALTKTGYSTELLSYQKEPKVEDDEKWPEKGNEHVRGRTGRETRKHCCPKKHRHPKMEDYDHKVEDYTPPEIDPYISIDPSCKHHRRRPIITNHAPSLCSTDLPHRAHGFLCYHGNPFDYHHPRTPPDGYGLHLRRPVHGFYNFTYFGDGYARGCTIM